MRNFIFLPLLTRHSFAVPSQRHYSPVPPTQAGQRSRLGRSNRRRHADAGGSRQRRRGGSRGTTGGGRCRFPAGVRVAGRARRGRHGVSPPRGAPPSCRRRCGPGRGRGQPQPRLGLITGQLISSAVLICRASTCCCVGPGSLPPRRRRRPLPPLRQRSPICLTSPPYSPLASTPTLTR